MRSMDPVSGKQSVHHEGPYEASSGDEHTGLRNTFDDLREPLEFSRKVLGG